MLKGIIEVDRKINEHFSDLKCECVEKPIAVIAQSIGGQTMKAKPGLAFEDLANVWLHGIDQEYNPQGGDKETLEEVYKRQGM